MKKQITIKNIQYDVDTKQYIEQASLGTVIKSLGLSNDGATYKAFTEAMGDEVKQEREEFWLNKINEDDELQNKIRNYIQKKNKVYGLHRAVGIQLGYIKLWAEDNGLLESVENRTYQIYEKLKANPENVAQIVADSGFTMSTVHQYVKRHVKDYDRAIVNLLSKSVDKSKMNLSIRLDKAEQRITEQDTIIAKLKEAITELQKTR